MIPTGLKIGDTYTETSVDGKTFVNKIIGFDGQGRYISEFVGMVSKKDEAVEEPDPEEEPLPLTEEVAEEPKKTVARKPATRKRKTTPKKK